MDPFTEKLLQKAEQRSRNLGINTKANNSLIDFHKKQIVENTVNKLNVVEQKYVDYTSNQNPSLVKRQFSVDKENMDLGIEINITTKPNVDIRVEVEEEDIESNNYEHKRDNKRTTLKEFPSNIKSLNIVQSNDKEYEFSAASNFNMKNSSQKFKKLAALADSINSWENEPSRDTKHPSRQISEAHEKNLVIPDLSKSKKNPVNIQSRQKSQQEVKSIINTANIPAKTTKVLNWDKNVMNSLEAQGFQRRDSSTTKYSYQYETKEVKQNTNVNNDKKVLNSNNLKNKPEFKKFEIGTISEKAKIFGNKNIVAQKDPADMTLKERMQLFEKNKGEALIPKAAFGMAIPLKKNTTEIKKNFEVKPSSTMVSTIIGNNNNLSTNKIYSNSNKQNKDLTKSIYENKNTVELTPPQNTKTTTNSIGLSKRRSPSITTEEKSCPNENSNEKRAKTVNRLYPILPDFEDTDSEINNCTTATVTTEEINDKQEDEWFVDPTDSEDDEYSTRKVNCENKLNQKENLKRKELRYANEPTYFGNDMSPKNTYNSSDLDSDLMQQSDSDYSIDSCSFERNEKLEAHKSDSFCYKKEVHENELPSKSVKSGSPLKSEVSVRKSGGNTVTLVHTVSFYRKQKSSSTNATPVRNIRREQIEENNEDDTSSEEEIDSDKDEDDIIKEKIKQLLDEVCKQQQIIGQSSQAINLCAATVEFSGSTEAVEGERHLLVATHRRQAALDEIQRLRVDGNLRPPGAAREKGQITIEEITLPLKHNYIRKLSANSISGHHLLCLIKYNENVLATKTVPTLPGLLAVKFPNTLQLNNIYADFRVSVEVYGMTAQREILPHEVKYHINLNKKTSQKKQNDSKLFMPLIQSPAGPNVVRTPALIQYGFAIFSLREIKRNIWTLNQISDDSPLDGVIKMKVNCELSVTVEHKGFLTMFEDLSGFGAWHRRWCYLNGHMLSYWKYPDDEKKKAPIGSIDLYTCHTPKVGIAPRDICARLNTMLLENHRPTRDDDVESLLIVPKGDTTIVRTLLSADTKEERNEWCSYLNKALTLIRTWDPSK